MVRTGQRSPYVETGIYCTSGDCVNALMVREWKAFKSKAAR
jgi:hypothetical protein